MVVEDHLVASKYIQLRKSAQRRGIEFTLRLSDVRRLLSRKRCFYTNEVMCDISVEDGDTVPSNKRTVDRIDNTKGYTRDNVVACTHSVNQFKCFVLENKASGAFLGVDTLFKIVKKLKEIQYD